MKTIACWRLETVNSQNHQVLVARFTTEDEAKKAELYTKDHYARVRKEFIMIFDTAVEWSPDKCDEEARESGLGKLTDRERAALGLV